MEILGGAGLVNVYLLIDEKSSHGGFASSVI
jgi:hypothetical protein